MLGVEKVTSIESKDVSAHIFQQIANGNDLPIQVMCCGVKGLTVEHLKGEKPVDLLVGEPFYYSMQNLSLWQALNFWLRRTALDRLLSSTAVVLPASAKVFALPVKFDHLHECFGAVGDVSDFNHAYFDLFQTNYYDKNFPFPVYMYNYSSSSDQIELAQWKFSDVAHSIDEEQTTELSQDINAVVMWVEYALDEERALLVTTGPKVKYCKQLVRFLPEQHGKTLKTAFKFNASVGTIQIFVEIV